MGRTLRRTKSGYEYWKEDSTAYNIETGEEFPLEEKIDEVTRFYATHAPEKILLMPSASASNKEPDFWVVIEKNGARRIVEKGCEEYDKLQARSV